MAGGHMKYRHLSRSSSHRQALLRNLVTSLFKHDSIATTWHKAKEAQRLAEQLVTLAKKNTPATRRRANQIFFEPNEMVPKLFGKIRERYVDRPGGYTRVLRIEPMKEDQSESAILELVDGTKDMRFAMTAMTLAQLPERQQFNEKTAENVKKVTQFRKDGVEDLQHMVSQMRLAKKRGIDKRVLPPPRKVYPETQVKREMHYFDDVSPYKRANSLVVRKSALKRKTSGKLAPSEKKSAPSENKDAASKSTVVPSQSKSAPRSSKSTADKSRRADTKPRTLPKPQMA